MNFRKLPEITKKQTEILNLIYRFRFINRKQLQRYLHHKDARRVNTWLRDLVEKKYLGRIYSHKLLENTKPAIYHLNNNGIIWVRYNKGEEYRVFGEQLEMKYLKKFYADKDASQTFINHCIMVFECYLQLKEVQDKSNETLEYQIDTKTELWITKQLYEDEDFNEIKNILPDLYIEKFKNPNKDTLTSSTFFLEVFDPKMPRYAIKYKIKEYIYFRKHGDWDFYTGLDKQFPIVLLIFPNQQRINFMSKFIREQLERSYDLDDIIFQVTTYKKAMTDGITAKIWQKISTE